MTGRIVRALTAVLIGAAGGMIAMPGPAQAAGACPAGTGVTVVVNSSVSCDHNGGGSVASNFHDAGHRLTTATRQPGFVCRVDGYPASDPCINTSPSNAYWALFWANGTGGGWTYASSGASGFSVPAGAWVAFKFQTSSSRSYPAIRPYTAPAAKPKPQPEPRATGSTAVKPDTSASRSTPKPARTAGTTKPSASAKASPSTSATSATEAAGDPTSRDDDIAMASNRADESNGMVWVGAGLAALLAVGIGTAAWRRRVAGRQP